MFFLLFLLLINGSVLLIRLHHLVQGSFVGHLGISVVVAFATTSDCGWIVSAAIIQNVVNDIMRQAGQSTVFFIF